MLTARALAERLSRGVILRRRLPRAFGGGPLFVSPEFGGLRYWHPWRCPDAPLLRHVAEFVQPGMCVWDIGANVGLFTFAAAFRAGRAGTVLAVEPDAECSSLLLRTRRHLSPGSAPVEIVTAAAGLAGQRLAQFNIASRVRSSNALGGFGTTQVGKIAESRVVPLLALDELASRIPPPDVLKIDVEGAELDVLHGAETLLSERHPLILAECGSAHAHAVGVLLRAHHYRIYDGGLPVGQRVPLETAPFDCLACF